MWDFLPAKKTKKSAPDNRLMDWENNPVGWSSVYPPDRLSNPDPMVSPRANPLFMTDEQRLAARLDPRYKAPTEIQLGDMQRRGQDLFDNGMTASGGVASIMGLNAAKFPMEALRFAEKMERAGASPESIWKGYGLFRDKAGNWKAEIPDDGLRLRVYDNPRPELRDAKNNPPGFYTSAPESWAPKPDPNVPAGWRSVNTGPARLYPSLPSGTRVGDVIEHPALFEQYPHLQNMLIGEPIDFTGSVRGAYMPDSKRVLIARGDADRVPQTLLHEFGHAVQHFEETPMGGNPQQFKPKNYQSMQDALASQKNYFDYWARGAPLSQSELERVRIFAGEPPEKLSHATRQFMESVKQTYPDLYIAARKYNLLNRAIRKADDEMYSSYRSLHGEQEAEAIANRANLTPRQRAERPFWEDYTMPVNNHLLGDVIPWSP